MKIRKADKSEIRELVTLYKDAFPVHNVFQLPRSKVQTYLEGVKGDFYVADDNGIVGAILLTIELKTRQHKRARIKYFAVAPEFQRKGIGTELIKYAEKMFEQGKIEIHVAEGEEVAFYKKNGYKIEGALASHYRKNETMYIMGKEI